ncbi:MAG: polysaccharide deacetylase family protein [Firmicutes bacterium]|nr:polysaccharide deacetylase family protein [Bacillota bacterium]
MKKSFKYIITIILIVTMLFTANTFVYADDTQDAPLSFLAKIASVFSSPANAAENAIDILKPALEAAVTNIKTAAEQPEFASSGEVDPSAPMVALTFDDGPYSPVTDRIVNKLQEYNARATFFVVGNRVSSFSDSVAKAVAAGNEIANHTWNHTSLTTLSGAQVHKQMNDADYAISLVTGKPASLMRPVGGAHNATVDASVGKPLIMWSLDTLDWKNRNATAVANAVLNNVKDGDIILMHDLYKSTADACDIIIPALAARGYQMVTVSELAAARGVTLHNGSTYSAVRP